MHWHEAKEMIIFEVSNATLGLKNAKKSYEEWVARLAIFAWKRLKYI